MVFGMIVKDVKKVCSVLCSCKLSYLAINGINDTDFF